jgi:hypothetical protein
MLEMIAGEECEVVSMVNERLDVECPEAMKNGEGLKQKLATYGIATENHSHLLTRHGRIASLSPPIQPVSNTV